MRSNQSCKLSLRAILSTIHPVDLALLLIMAILLLQSVYNIFICSGTQQSSNEIDIIVRTSAASIFGYFLSGNFMRHSGSISASPPSDQAHIMETADNSQTQSPNFSTSTEIAPPTLTKTSETMEQDFVSSPDPVQVSCLQVWIAAGIGLFCLITLLLLRNTEHCNTAAQSDSVAATIVQFRDFISGCVGFLIGHPTQQTNQT